MHTKRLRSRTSAAVSGSRWAAYATAGAATALLPIDSAEADISYSGLINRPFEDTNPGATGGLDIVSFALGPNAHFEIAHGDGPVAKLAGFYITGLNSGMFRGVVENGYPYPSRFASGVNVSLGNFVANDQGYLATMAAQDQYGQFRDPGIGFIGFRFDGGSGVQYGWVRVNMNGSDNRNTFTLIDYAFADVGEQIATGQVPEPGSLALLAVGGAGILAWRKRRRTAGVSG